MCRFSARISSFRSTSCSRRRRLEPTPCCSSSRRYGLDVLVEVHDPKELAIAVDAGARIVGVNNRNLRTLEVDVRASDELIARMPADVIAVSESGLRTSEDLVRLQRLGY